MSLRHFARHCAALCALIALSLAPIRQGEPQDLEKLLAGIEKTEHFEIRFRPDSRAEAAVDRVSALVEADLELIRRELDLPDFKHVIRLFLYDDVADLQKTTGVPAAGYSVTLASHVPCDNDQTRVHELVHVVAEQFKEKGKEPRNLFFAEGLANAVLRFVSGVHVDAVAAFHRRRGELPALAEFVGAPDFYAWLAAHPGFNAYDVAGSWFRFLLDTFGAAKTRRYYVGVPVREAFGAELDSLEKRWHAHLDQVVLRPGLLKLLEERTDGPHAPLRSSPEAQLDAKVLGPDSSWTQITREVPAPRGSGEWKSKKSDAPSLELSGEKNQGDWCVASFASTQFEDAFVRARFTPRDGCYGVRLELGPKCQALLLKGQGLFLYDDAKAVAVNARVQLPDAPVEIALRRRGTRASVWIDGQLSIECAVVEAPDSVGVGCVGGPAVVEQIATRTL